MKRRDGDLDADDARKSGELLRATPVFPSATAVGSTGSFASAATLRDDARKPPARPPVPFGSLSEALGYAVFVVLFVVATSVVEETEPAFYFASRLKAALVQQPFAIPVTLRSSSTGAVLASPSGSSSVQKGFGAIQDQPDVWAFLQGPFADAIYGAELDASAGAQADASETAGLALSNNRVLGGVRLRTLRVKPDACPALSQIPEYASVLPFCYERFSVRAQQTRGYGPVLNSADIAASSGFAFAKAFFADKGSSKSYADLQTCYSDCERQCGHAFGVEQYRYVGSCAAQCGIHCKCVYEQPVDFDLCPDPNPDGAGAAIPAPRYAYNWSSAAETKSLATSGFTGATYAGSGYVFELAANGSLARSALEKLRRDRFIDLATRALVVDVTVFNAYLQLFTIVQLVAEFPATGGTFIQFSDVVVRPFRYSVRSAWRVALECLLAAYVAISWKALVQRAFRARGVLALARRHPWDAITLLFLLVFTAAIGFRLYMVDQAYGTLSGHVAAAIDAASLSEVPNFQALARLCDAEGVLGSAAAALVWLKLLQYAQVSRRVCVLLRALRRAAPDLSWFFVYFVVCICGFAQVGYLLFGLRVRQFRSLGAAVLTLLQAVAGDLDFAALSDSRRVLGPLYYVAFYLLLLLVLLNVFLAILNDAYVQTIAEDEEEDGEREEQEDASDDGELDADADADVDSLQRAGAVEDAETRLSRQARRELEQLRKYPFSRGVALAFRLLALDLKRAIDELRTGRKARVAKVDPFVTVLGETERPRGHDRGDPISASRKWTAAVKKQLDKQIEQHTRVRASRELQAKDEQLAALRSSVDTEIAERLAGLVESNRQKTQRMADMEKTLGAVEALCQQLLRDTAYLRDASDEESEAPRTGGSQRGLQVPRASHGRSTTAAAPRRAPTMFRPQSLAAALRSGSSSSSSERKGSRGGGGSKRFAKKGGAEEVEEITL